MNVYGEQGGELNNVSAEQTSDYLEGDVNKQVWFDKLRVKGNMVKLTFGNQLVLELLSIVDYL